MATKGMWPAPHKLDQKNLRIGGQVKSQPCAFMVSFIACLATSSCWVNFFLAARDGQARHLGQSPGSERPVIGQSLRGLGFPGAE